MAVEITTADGRLTVVCRDHADPSISTELPTLTLQHGSEGVRSIDSSGGSRIQASFDLSDVVAARTTGSALREHVLGTEAVLHLPVQERGALVRLVGGLLLGLYDPRDVAAPPEPGRLHLVLPAGGDLPAVQREVEILRGIWWARDLANTPANIKSPPWLARTVLAEAERNGLTTRELGAAELTELEAGGLLAVASASSHDPRLVILEYRPDSAPNAAHLALVGKGITFDSGGLSIKPADSMALMKTDMAGAAAVAAATVTAARLGLPIRITALLAIAENHIGADAMRPGDVITHPRGRRSEVLNTDAEGRLVLADALDYVALNVRPDLVVDVATLTGAATMALSRRVGALMTEDEDMAAGLLAAVGDDEDALWRLPLVPAYREAISSDIADAANTSTDPTVSAGAITAAWFLAPFAEPHRWAHLDIAGPARAESPRPGVPKGATGYGVRLLVDWISTALVG